MTFEVTLNEEEYNSISECAAKMKCTAAEFILQSVRERIKKSEDDEWFAVSKKLIERNKKVYEALAK